jgi:microcystin degradation protein MlrC
MGYKLITGGISHESNTFSNSPTTLEDFKRQTYSLGMEVLRKGAEQQGVIGGFIQVAVQSGVELLPTIYASTTPKGPLTREAFDHLMDELLSRSECHRDTDGAILSLHGAMVVRARLLQIRHLCRP